MCESSYCQICGLSLENTFPHEWPPIYTSRTISSSIRVFCIRKSAQLGLKMAYGDKMVRELMLRKLYVQSCFPKRSNSSNCWLLHLCFCFALSCFVFLYSLFLNACRWFGLIPSWEVWVTFSLHMWSFWIEPKDTLRNLVHSSCYQLFPEWLFHAIY